MCEMSFRTPADLARQPFHIAGLLKQWCGDAIYQREKGSTQTLFVDFVYRKWYNYIHEYGVPTNQRESEDIIFEFLQDRANEYNGLLQADRYIDLASQLLENVRWIGQSANASYANALYEGRTYLS